MQGLVTLDFGNSHPHAGLFSKKNGEWSFLKSIPLESLEAELLSHQMNPGNTVMVLSEVKSRPDKIENLLHQGYLITRLKDYWRGKKFAGMPVHYAQTLGEDRLVEAFYCFKKLKSQTLIIDAGTYLTIDIITENGFLGGHICPGIKTYLETFKRGENLKHIDLQIQNIEAIDKLPTATSEAMESGYLAFFTLVQSLITRHQIQKVLITGGDGEVWRKFFSMAQYSGVVEVEKDLIHFALHYWMTSQIELL